MTAAVTILSTKAAVVAGVIAALSAHGVMAENVQTFHGRFTLATLQKFGSKTPAARVVTTGVMTDGDRAATISARMRFTVYLITSDSYTKDSPPVLVPRDQAMDNLVNALISALNENAFGDDADLGMDQPTDISAENVYSDDAAGMAVLLWAVSWTQDVELDVLTPNEYAALNNFITLTQTIEDPDDDDVPVIGDSGPVNN